MAVAPSPAEETLDVEPMRAFVASAAAQIDRPVRNARLEMLPDLTFELTTAQAGRRLEQEEGLALLVEAAQTGEPTVDLPVSTLNPVTTDEMRLPAKAKAEKIVAGARRPEPTPSGRGRSIGRRSPTCWSSAAAPASRSRFASTARSSGRACKRSPPSYARSRATRS